MTTSPMSSVEMFDTVLAAQPEVLAALTDLHTAAWSAVDAHLLAMCEARVAMLLGNEAVRQSQPVSDTGRACLAFTEQFVIDVASIDDDTVGAVLDALGPDGLVNFANALLVVEQRQRLHLMCDRLLS